MKKILIGALIVLLIIMAYFAIFKGISLGNLEVLSVKQIQEENDKLTESITQSENLMRVSYPAKTDELEKTIFSLLTAKEEYQDLANVSTEGELKEANKQETYKEEYLWTRIGRHATSEGILLTFGIESGTTGEAEIKNLSFNVTGNYLAIINFISALENDGELGFRIENFKMSPGSDTNARQATFIVRNIRIKMETTTSGSTNTNTPTDTTTQTQSDTNVNSENIAGQS